MAPVAKNAIQTLTGWLLVFGHEKNSVSPLLVCDFGNGCIGAAKTRKMFVLVAVFNDSKYLIFSARLAILPELNAVNGSLRAATCALENF